MNDGGTSRTAYHFVINKTRIPVYLTVRPDRDDPAKRVYTLSLTKVRRPSDAIASAWVRPDCYVGVPIEGASHAYRLVNKAKAVLCPGTYQGRNAWVIRAIKM